MYLPPRRSSFVVLDLEDDILESMQNFTASLINDCKVKKC